MPIEKPLIVYGHDYCPQAHSLIKILDSHGVKYEYRDVQKGKSQWANQVRRMANGNLSVPTIVFSNGDYLVEPWNNLVLEYLGLKEPGWFDRLADWMAKRKESDSSKES